MQTSQFFRRDRRLACGVPPCRTDDRPAWTGSCPCQPFSRIGKKLGFDDDRHLWPVWRNLIAECRPATVFGEQTADASAWLRDMLGDLEDLGYAVGAIAFEAASAGSFHWRDRYWIVADCGDEHGSSGRPQRRDDPAEACDQSDQRSGSLIVGNAKGDDEWGIWQSERAREGAFGRSGTHSRMEWVTDKHGKSRPVESGVCGLAHGLPGGGMVVRPPSNVMASKPKSRTSTTAREYSKALATPSISGPRRRS
jgi:site-specific DNA-cytosine methylase